jgi:hypothetical protein
MERKLLSELNFCVSPPTANIFVRRFIKFAGADRRCKCMADVSGRHCMHCIIVCSMC